MHWQNILLVPSKLIVQLYLNLISTFVFACDLSWTPMTKKKKKIILIDVTYVYILVRVMVYSQQIAPSYQVLLVLYHGGQFYWCK